MLESELLKDIRVVELANVLAGPSVGMFLAECGAEVIKIENKQTGGDITRKWKLPDETTTDPFSAYFCSTNWGKTYQLLDLHDPTDHLQVMELIERSDIVISNFKPRSAQRFALDASNLRQAFPHLIYAQLYAFDESEDRLAFDVVLQAETGFLHMTGTPEGPPVKMPVALIDLLAAHQLKEGILLALIRRMKTGKGATVKTSLLKSGIASLANQATNWLMAKHIPQKMGTQHPNIAPYGDMFTTQDHKYIVLAVGTDVQFINLCTCLGLHHLISHEHFATNTSRVRYRKELVQLLQEVISTFLQQELLERLHQQGVPAGSIRNMKEVFELPIAQHMILSETLPDGSISQRVATVAFEIED